MNSKTLCLILGALITSCSHAADKVPHELQRWLTPQEWQRDTEGPALALGAAGSFDDTHIFAPCVARGITDSGRDRFLLWYCGSSGTVAERVFRLGHASSEDGRRFERRPDAAPFGWSDGKHSILTPTLLRDLDGSVTPDRDKFRMWFSSTDFTDPRGLHTLHETTSADGIHWSTPSAAQLENVYAPSILRTGRTYQMWFTDVAAKPWIIRHAQSEDGEKWRVTPDPVVSVGQAWEKDRLFYPTVVRVNGVYLMWYGSYWKQSTSQKTALGFAASLDGLKWYKSAHNPVLRPDPKRAWESHYVTSQSVMRLPDGTWRMWYASRKSPPFVNKYFAINTAQWSGPVEPTPKSSGLPAASDDLATLKSWQQATREQLRDLLGIPKTRVPLAPESRGQFEQDGIVVEKWIFTSEPGSRVPAVLYRPKELVGRIPAIVLTYGHGGSKSNWQYNYAGQLYAKLGLACLAIDPLGEEERHLSGRTGTRAHDPRPVHDCSDQAGRLIMGKFVFDTMRGIDFLETRQDIQHDRIGVAGNSLGGATAGWMAAVEPRVKMALVCGWAFDDIGLRTKFCTRVPNERMRELLSWSEYVSLAAPQCAVLIMNGDADVVIDRDADSSAWQGTRAVAAEASKTYAKFNAAGKLQAWFEKDGGHRPYFAYKEALLWIQQHLGTPGWTNDLILKLPVLNSGEWCDRHGVVLEKLYGIPLHERGATLPDLGLRPMTRNQLAVLRATEIGAPEFTLEGWLAGFQK